MKYKIYLLGACAILGAEAFLAQNLPKYLSSDSNVSVAVKDFSDGTKIAYKLIADGNIVKQGVEEINNGKVFKLPLPKEASENEYKKIDYKLNISKPNDGQVTPAKALDLLLKLDRDNGDVSLSGSGVNEFTDIMIDNGKEKSKITSDWAGIFSSDSINDNINSTSNKTELAFQNYGIGNDLSQVESGKIEVLFGDPDGSSKAKVQERYTRALIMMTEELSAVMALQTEAIGMFFDASIQLKTQRKHQELMARAHKDYHPSEQMCRIGTFIRSVAHAESKAEVNKHALNKIMMNQYLSATSSSAGAGMQINDIAEMYSYTNYYCDHRDNNAATALLCPPTGSPDSDTLYRLNKDIDYTRTLGSKLTIDVDFVGDSIANSSPITDDKADVIALAKNLYFPNIFELPLVEDIEKNIGPHYNSRSFATKMNVAHNSLINIVGMKSSAPDAIAADSGWAHMKALVREFGVTNDDEIEDMLGERPSYYAQMEVLSKKIYQHPNFYTNLYDKPANVDRIGASIDAITLMHQRDRYDSLLRREMLTAILLEDGLSKHSDMVSANIFKEMNQSQ